MKLAALLFLASPLLAQSLALSVSPASVKPGGSATLTLTWTDLPQSVNLAGIQWSVTSPGSVTVGAGVIGAAASSAAKVIACAGLTCLVYGINANPIASGVLASASLTVAAGTVPATIPLSLAGVVGADANGSALTITSTGATLNVVASVYDLNRDGKVDSADVALAVAQALAPAQACTADVNGDGKCNVLDVQLVILAALGRIPL